MVLRILFFSYLMFMVATASAQVLMNIAPWNKTEALRTTSNQISMNDSATCALIDGHPYCWGWGGNYMFGVNVPFSGTTPTPVRDKFLTSGVTKKELGDIAVCAIENGAAKCWGWNKYGQWGDGSGPTNFTTTTAKLVTGLGSGVTDIEVGGVHACAVHNGAAKCWGESVLGNLGDGTTNDAASPVAVTGLGSLVTQISVAELSYDLAASNTTTTCAVHNGAAKCWGGNATGSLGNGTTTLSTTPVQVSGLTSGVTMVAAGHEHSCAVHNGAAKCWGLNDEGQLGDDTQTNSTTPVQVSGLTSGVTAVAVGTSFSCAIHNGAAKCWGDVSLGILGSYIAKSRQLTPIQVTGLTSGVTTIAAARFSACAVHNNVIKCWGSGWTNHNIGIPTRITQLMPITAETVDSNITFLTGGYDQTCSIKSGALYCWGISQVACDIGTPPVLPGESYSGWQMPFSGVSFTTGITQASTARLHTCVVKSDSAFCSGQGTEGQLGGGTYTGGFYYPTQVSTLTTGVSMVATGGYHSCAVHNGAAKCWGKNTNGQLGNSTNTTTNTPVQVTGLTTGVTYIAAGPEHTCAIHNGAVKCWGRGTNGELGNGLNTSSNAPVQVTGLTAGASMIAIGMADTETTGASCAIVSGALKCWGPNNKGQLGNNSTTASSSPVDVSGMSSGVTHVAVGLEHACAIQSGVAKCWGNGADGRLGNNGTADSLVPVDVVAPVANFTGISAGDRFSCGVFNSAVQCWGYGDALRLGRYIRGSWVPVTVRPY